MIKFPNLLFIYLLSATHFRGETKSLHIIRCTCPHNLETSSNTVHFSEYIAHGRKDSINFFKYEVKAQASMDKG